jgi:hypothetical protein
MEAIAWVCIFIAFACAFVVAVDEIRHPQKMWIMNLVANHSSVFQRVRSLGLLRYGQKRQSWRRRSRRYARH